MRAAKRWITLLQTSSMEQALLLVRTRAEYTDLTLTQYSAALDWLLSVGFLADGDNGRVLVPMLVRLSRQDAMERLFERALEASLPAWLPDADVLIRDATELPEDAARLARVLGLGDPAALRSIHRAQGHVDLTERSRVGAAGEERLAELLERSWPGSAQHVALLSDAYGYDIIFTPEHTTWHLEVKTTTRRGRLVVYLSRHEFDVALVDPSWRLVVVGLDQQNEISAIATVRAEVVAGRAPKDVTREASWQSARYSLGPSDLDAGFSFFNARSSADPQSCEILDRGFKGERVEFVWVPCRASACT